MASARPLIVGVGNVDRGDDAAGLLVARRMRTLAGARLDVAEVTGDLTGLIEAWEGRARVLVVDAVAGHRAGVLHRLDRRTGWPPPLRASTHGLSVETVVRVADALGRAPADLAVFGVEGVAFSMGSPPSPALLAAVDAIALRVLEHAWV